MKPIYTNLLICFGLLASYFLFWPTSITPVSWNAPKTYGLIGEFESNTRLADMETWPFDDLHGPEGIAVDSNSMLLIAYFIP